MLRDVLGQLDLSGWAEASLAIFALTFLAVTIRTLLMDRDAENSHAHIVLDDGSKEG